MLSLDVQAAALCPQSPTGKHHWMIPSTGAHPLGICKWCEAERQFENSCGDGRWDYGEKHNQVVRQQIAGKGSREQYEEASRYTPHIW